MKRSLLLVFTLCCIGYLVADAIAWPGPVEKVKAPQAGYATISGLSKLPGDYYAILKYTYEESGTNGKYTVNIATADKVSFKVWENSNLWTDNYYICWDPSLKKLAGKTVRSQNLGVDLDYSSGGAKQNCMELPFELMIFGFSKTNHFYDVARGQAAGTAPNVWLLNRARTVFRHSDMALSVSPEGSLDELNQFTLQNNFTPFKLINGKAVSALANWVSGKPGFTYGKASTMTLPLEAPTLVLAKTKDVEDSAPEPEENIDTDTLASGVDSTNNPQAAPKGITSAKSRRMIYVAALAVVVVLYLLMWVLRKKKDHDDRQ